MVPEGTTPTNQQPQPTPAAPDRAAIEKEVLSQVFGDKNFASVDDAKRSYWELTNYASQAHKALSERANPALSEAQRPDPFKRLQDEALVPADAFRDAVGAVVSPLLEQALNPIVQAISARNELAVDAPEYLANERNIHTWLRSNPVIAQEVQLLNEKGLYKIAAKHALTNWMAANPPADKGNAEAKAQAALPNSGTAVQRSVDPAQMADMRVKALEWSQRTGDRRPAYSMVFPNFEIQIPPHLQAQLQG